MSRSDDRAQFDGPAVAGGSLWSLDEVVGAPRPAAFGTASPPVDEATRGIGAGEVWTVSGEAGIGVTALVTTLASGIVRSGGDVSVANGHVPTRALARRLTERADDAAARIRVTAWLRVPWLGDEDWTLSDTDVVVLDTYDEMWRPPHWERSPEQRIADARWLRELGRRTGTAVVLTQRRPVGTARTAMDDVFEDVADVRLDLARGEHPRMLDFTITSRRGAPWRGPLRLG